MKSFLLYGFPKDKKKISKLSLDDKLEWYASQNPQDMVFLGNNPDFQTYWKLHALFPMKLKRFYYRVKNGEIFKHYKHITDTKITGITDSNASKTDETPLSKRK